MRDYRGLLEIDEQGYLWDDTAVPYVRLWAAVLYQGIFDYAKYLTGSREEHNIDARRWVESNNTKGCSFVWICRVLRLNPVLMRDKIYEHRIKIAERKLMPVYLTTVENDDGF